MRVGFMLLALPVVSSLAAAPSRAESVFGVVLDRVQGREIPVNRVQVKLCSDRERKRCGTTLTQVDGRFHLEVPPGTYIFVGELPGGATFTTRVTIAAGRPSSLRIYLPR